MVVTLTQVVYGVAGLVQCARVELQADDGEDEDGKHDEERDLHQRRQRLQDGLEHHLQTYENRYSVTLTKFERSFFWTVEYTKVGARAHKFNSGTP